MKKGIIYVHGKGGNHLEGNAYRKNCPDYDIIGVEYNEYLPWIVEDKIRAVFDKMVEKYDEVYLIANSIGAYFSMHALQKYHVKKALFISPILDMEQLILNMISWVGTTEEELKEKGEIETSFGETLSWEYLSFVRENPINWNIPTEILYGERDNLTSLATVEIFAAEHNAGFTIMKNGEHWFHTKEQIIFLNNWMKKILS